MLQYRRGTVRREGPGLTFWFRTINTSVAEVPVDDRELPFLFHVRSADFQELTAQGVISFRVVDPRRVARRIDFTIDLQTGRWTQTPLEQLAGLLMQLAQQFVIDDLLKLGLRRIQSAMPANVLLALALRELAGQLGTIEHLTITPDMLTPLLTRLGTAEA